MKKELNEAAEAIIQRINDKLRGTEFPVRQQKCRHDSKKEQEGVVINQMSDIEDQVDLLI